MDTLIKLKSSRMVFMMRLCGVFVSVNKAAGVTAHAQTDRDASGCWS